MTAEQKKRCEENIKLVYFFANKYRNCALEYDDIVSLAQLGLCKAAISYDPTRGLAFSSFAGRCIYCEIFCEVRKRNVSSRKAVVLSLDAPLNCTADATFSDIVPDGAPPLHDALERIELSEDLLAHMVTLPERDRYILTEIFVGRKRQCDVAKQLGLTQAYVSRLRQNALAKLKNKLREEAFT
ncbi:MAG: sigma-70 family RNA polymerase sigma factor [Oscillospiraceae bacterium]|nr:sigma-70 family RNA polymerase sigma factor [Oscillospiraceae bacterium]